MELNDRQIVELACKTLAEKKAVDIKIIEVVGMTDITDYFIVCSGRSMPQVKALCDHVEETLSKEGIEPRRTEGTKEGRWGVLDYGDVIVHVFNDESRLFYHLERLWDEGNNVVRYTD